jgi:hypothetical protein
MVAEKVFVSCIIVLLLFNFIFYVSGYNPDLLSVGSIIGIFVTLGGIAVIVSFIPTVSAGGTVQWFATSLIMVGLFYSVSFQVLSYNVHIGLGLASNITNMFSADMGTIAFMPFLFFTAIGLIGIISGIIMFAGSTE